MCHLDSNKTAMAGTTLEGSDIYIVSDNIYIYSIYYNVRNKAKLFVPVKF